MSGPVDQTLPSPITLAYTMEGDTVDMWVEVFKDVDDNPIMDAAKQLPLKPVFVLQAVAVYTITKVIDSYTHAQWRNENNTLNSTTWNSWTKGEAWCCSRWKQVNYNNVDAYEVTYTVRCLRGGWQTRTAEAGYAYLDGTDLRDWRTDDGSVTIGKLTEAGGKAGADSDLVIKEWDTKRMISFSFLPA